MSTHARISCMNSDLVEALAHADCTPGSVMMRWNVTGRTTITRRVAFIDVMCKTTVWIGFFFLYKWIIND